MAPTKEERIEVTRAIRDRIAMFYGNIEPEVDDDSWRLVGAAMQLMIAYLNAQKGEEAEVPVYVNSALLLIKRYLPES